MNDLTPKNLDETKALAKDLATADTLPQALQKKPADLLAIILTGSELGLSPMQSIRGIAIIKGKPTLSADTVGALVRRNKGVCEWLRIVESTDTVCTLETKRVGDPEPTKFSFTIEQAKRAGLAGGDNWRKYPEAMLRARCTAAICRAVYPDLVMGIYDPDELSERPPVPVANEVIPQAVESTASRNAPQLTAMTFDQGSGAQVEAKPVEPTPVVDFQEPNKAAFDGLMFMMKAIGNRSDLAGLVPRIKQCTPDEQKLLREAYGQAMQRIDAEVRK